MCIFNRNGGKDGNDVKHMSLSFLKNQVKEVVFFHLALQPHLTINHKKNTRQIIGWLFFPFQKTDPVRV